MLMQSGQHLLALISDILDLTRMASGEEAIDIQTIDVGSLCAMALMLITPAAQSKHIDVRHTIMPGITVLRADEGRMTQILVNLLNNALKFTPAGGSVGLDVAANTARDRIQFSVWDTGIGIIFADQSRIFEPFTQLDARLSREYEGVGLGLTLVRRLVDLHGGSITLASTPGQGSRFTISLPSGV
jgi:signal transduction histidine kinase